MPHRLRLITLGLLAILLLGGVASAQPVSFDIRPAISKTVALSGERISFGLGLRPSPCLIAWDFGDGSSDEGWPVIHTYAAAGRYDVRAQIVCNAQATPVAARPVQITVARAAVALPKATIFASLTAVVALEQRIAFDAGGSSDGAGGTNLRYRWDFGDGTTAVGPTATHVYRSVGDFTATLIVTDLTTNVEDSAQAAISVAAPAGGLPTATPTVTSTPLPQPTATPTVISLPPYFPGLPDLDTTGLSRPRLDSGFDLVHLGYYPLTATIPPRQYPLLRSNVARTRLRGTATSNAAWLMVSPAQFDTTGPLIFDFTVAGDKLLPGQSSWATVSITINGAVYDVVVAVAVGGLTAAQSAQVDALAEQTAAVLQANQTADLLLLNERYANPGQLVQGLAAHFVLNAGYQGRMPAGVLTTRAAELIAGRDFDRDGWAGFTDFDRSLGAVGAGSQFKGSGD